MKIFVVIWQFLGFIYKIAQVYWRYISPIKDDVVNICKKVKELGLSNEESRKKVFQEITDCIQKRGLEKYPDSVLNSILELTYQLYVWKHNSSDTEQKEGIK